MVLIAHWKIIFVVHLLDELVVLIEDLYLDHSHLAGNFLPVISQFSINDQFVFCALEYFESRIKKTLDIKKQWAFEPDEFIVIHNPAFLWMVIYAVLNKGSLDAM
jgi:hypothetical protein